MPKRSAQVSVVVPCFRCVTTICRAIESIAAQTLRPAEVIVVDDGSDDATRDLLRMIQSDFGSAWLDIIELARNEGPGSARNAGWEAASQPYIAFLDADDAWHPQKIELQFQWMDAHPEAALTGHRSIRVRPDYKPEFVTSVSCEARRVSTRRLLLHNDFPTRSVMVRREVKHRFKAARRYSEDYELWLRLALDGYQLWTLRGPLAFSFKPDFGGAGLTGDLWRMQKGELQAYRGLRQEGLLSVPWWTLAASWSLARFARRLVLDRLSGITGALPSGADRRTESP